MGEQGEFIVKKSGLLSLGIGYIVIFYKQVNIPNQDLIEAFRFSFMFSMSPGQLTNYTAKDIREQARWIVESGESIIHFYKFIKNTPVPLYPLP
jgi:hypothetical protein